MGGGLQWKGCGLASYEYRVGAHNGRHKSPFISGFFLNETFFAAYVKLKSEHQTPNGELFIPLRIIFQPFKT